MKPFAYDSGSPFDLRTSPFYVFSVSPGDDRVAIEDAKETAISDGRLSEVQALRLEQLLMAPRPRLGAELAWLLGVVPNRVRKLIDEISLVAEDAADLPPLAAANIAAHRCAQNLAPVHADLLVSFYALNDEEETLSLLNSLPTYRIDLALLVLQKGRSQRPSLHDDHVTLGCDKPN